MFDRFEAGFPHARDAEFHRVRKAGYEIPEGTTPALPQRVVRRDPVRADDPETVRPERFSGG